MAIKRRQYSPEEDRRLKRIRPKQQSNEEETVQYTKIGNRQRNMASKQIQHHLKTNISHGEQKNTMQHEIQSCQQDQDIQFITCEGTVSCAQIGNAVRKKTSKQIHHNFKTNIWYGIQTRNDEVLRPVFASFEVLSIRLTIENGIERLRVGCQFTRSVEIERFNGQRSAALMHHEMK